MSNPQPGGPGSLRSEFSFSLTDCLQRLTSSIYPWFGIGVFLLLDILPAKADEPHLPGCGVRVVPLLGYVGPRHPIPYYSDATPVREDSPIRHTVDASLRRITPARGSSMTSVEKNFSVSLLLVQPGNEQLRQSRCVPPALLLK